MFICCNVGMKEIGQTKALFVKAIHFSVAIQDIGGEEREQENVDFCCNQSTVMEGLFITDF